MVKVTKMLENGEGRKLSLALVSLTLAGAALGYLVSGGVEWGIRYIAAAVLVYTISFVFHELELYRQSFFMPLSAGLVMALTGFLGSFSASAGDAAGSPLRVEYT